ncbi:hypothetical protein [Mastigocoleus testarum]|uniref:hypothetical protein n=1 Tax=Mastigocoleus testarum TaxID=996925 RepID=UPI000412CC2D|nr:hypothetical protein [Mastigocoleus testarum]
MLVRLILIGIGDWRLATGHWGLAIGKLIFLLVHDRWLLFYVFRKQLILVASLRRKKGLGYVFSPLP